MLDRFVSYALAFEEAVISDDWSVVATFFTDDAVYETNNGPPFGGIRDGRTAILSFFRQSLDEFDRRFDSREGELIEGPSEKDGAVWIRWAARYRVAGAPELRIEGEERAYFEGDRIRRLVDHIPDEVNERIARFMSANAAALRTGA
ncbi:MAG: nuclear transport factor 2 family protein [Myxococcota bacterium]